ncbi:MAG: hypothetical protein MJE77_07110 [Proteobacteria bacterium]|nr:hypothetical protein [Pseudomonadota bacterium]
MTDVNHKPKSTAAAGHRPAPQPIGEFAAQAADYVRAAVGIELDYTSETLPLVDHYLRGVPSQQPELVELVITTAGAYFGEVVRRRLGGRWQLVAEKPTQWRMILPIGLSICPAGIAAAVIAQSDDLDDLDTGLDAPDPIWPVLEAALERMSQVTTDEYFSLCGRLDTLEHLQEVLAAALARTME